MIGDVIYQREECLAQASMCREKAQADPVRNDYWIDQAIEWLQRAMQSRRANPLTHEIHDGRMIPKRTDNIRSR